MAGFAVNVEVLLQNPNATMPFRAGYEEDEFLKSIELKLEQIEPLANNCTEILVWHTQTKKETIPTVKISTGILETDKTSLGMLLRELEVMGVSHTSQSDGEYYCGLSDRADEVTRKIIFSGVKATMTKDYKTKSLSSWF